MQTYVKFNDVILLFKIVLRAAVLSSGEYAHVQTPYWLGGTDATVEGGWEWVDGTPLAYINWFPGIYWA